MQELLTIAKRPAVSTHPGATAREVSALMMNEGVGAVVVLDGGKLVGIVSERDVVGKIVVPRRDPETTPVSEIMTTNVRTANEQGTTIPIALEIMHEGQFRHLPIVNAAGEVVGMLSVRHLLRERVAELARHNADLVNYISVDGPGG